MGLGFTPWTPMLCLHLPLPPCPSLGEGAAGPALWSLSPWPAGLLLAQEPPGFGEAGAAAHWLLGVLWGIGAGLGWRMRAVLGVPLPALANPWERPGWPRAGLPLGPLLLLNGDRKEGGRREGTHGFLPVAWWDRRKTVLEEGC